MVKINATIAVLSGMLHEGVKSDDIMASYMSSLQSNKDVHLQLSCPVSRPAKQTNINKEDIEESKSFPDFKFPADAFANISRIDEQMSLLSVAQRIGNPTIIEHTIKDEIATQSTDFLHTVGLKALLVAISSPQPHISVEEAPSNIVKIEDLSLTNTQTMVTKLLQTSHILYNAQVRNIFIYLLSHLI